jgi:hypothetical protein
LPLARRSLPWCLTVLLSASCTNAPEIANAEASPDALARTVLSAIAHQDADRLRRVALSEEEFREVVWPELPAARPERNIPFGYAWGDLRSKSEAALAGMLAQNGGKSFELVSIRFSGGSTQYQTYVVHREAVLRVRDLNGADQEVRLFGSVLERDGACKVFSYVVD